MYEVGDTPATTRGRDWPAPLPTVRDVNTEARGWRAHAGEVATCYDTRLVNRRDVWGAYLPPERRTTGARATYTAPSKAKRGAWQLDAWRLTRHVLGESPGHLVGVHSTSAEDTSRWGAFDLDAHGPQPVAYLDSLRAAAADLASQLAAAGAFPLVEDSNGAGGWHVWVAFDRPAPTAAVYVWLDALAERARLTFGVAVETYPKQASARGAFGNWLRLPGRHHTRPHWSRVARIGEAWASGSDAALVLVEWSATPVSVIPPASSWSVRGFGTPALASADMPSDRAPIIRSYVRQLAHGHAGSGRSDRLFSLARFLCHGMRCTEGEALGIMRAWNAGNVPPLPDAKVVATWTNAGTYSAKPYALRAGGRYAA